MAGWGRRTSRWAGRLALWLAAGGWAAPVCYGAHELRADWASPATLEALEAATPGSAAARAELRMSRPYGVADLVFQAVRLRAGRWMLHAASLRHPVYADWHLGLGREFPLSRRATLLTGLRVFGIDAGDLSPPRAAATMVLSLAPDGLPFLRLQGGVADAGSGAPDAPASIAFARARFQHRQAGLIVDRSVCRNEDPETTLLLWCRFGRLGCVQGYRWSTGEMSLALTLRLLDLLLTVGERWHPHLGATPRVALGWTCPGG